MKECPNCGEQGVHIRDCDDNVAAGTVCGTCREIRDTDLLKYIRKYEPNARGCQCAP